MQKFSWDKWICCFTFNAICFGQLDRAGLSGTITDQSDAVIPKAVVTAVQTSTQMTFSTPSNESGLYNFIGLPVGSYSVKAVHPGFSEMIQPDVILTSGSSVRVDLVLRPGTVNERVSVTAAAPLVEERSSAYGVTVRTGTLNELPLQASGGQRSLYGFVATVPGAVNQNQIMGGVGYTGQVVVDGVTAEYHPSVMGQIQVPPSVEIVGEFKVVNSVSAEYGPAGGAFTSFVTKSGTNAFHGSAYEYLRNSDMDARTFFAQSVASNKQNEFGFTAGGPVVIPHIYDGRNKTFIFGNLHEYRQVTATAGVITTVAVPAFRAGDFSSLLGAVSGSDAQGRPINAGAIYDPDTTRPTSTGGFIRDPFPGNIIPTARISPVSAKYQDFYPLPNVAGKLSNNYVESGGANRPVLQSGLIKVDQMAGKGRIAVSYYLVKQTSVSKDPLSSYLGGDGHSYTKNQYVRVAYNRPVTDRGAERAATH